jgi:hypothetical protein
MCQVGRVVHPNPSAVSFHKAKYEIFKDLYDFQKEIHEKMKRAETRLGDD